MVLTTTMVMKDPALLNPRVVVITDRTDLDDQLYSAFLESEILLEAPKQVLARAELREEVAAKRVGGILFTTLQKIRADEGGEGVRRRPPAPRRPPQHRRKAVVNRAKDPEGELQLFVVNTMLLTGLDAPPVHTMYLDRSFKGIGLMQALSLVTTRSAPPPGFNADLKRETLRGARRLDGADGAHACRLAVFRWTTRYNTRRRHSAERTVGAKRLRTAVSYPGAYRITT
ncbi:hypothetical protein [Streptomyces sp. NPDC056188]|uniref:type I restriction enzyme subunit R domain-containing protein n=1 Tax=Streptomyces sp. NPDC056188 TaxID=3345740 RepID=UPI0035DBDC41